MGNAAAAVIAGGLSGGFALAGVGVNSWIATRREHAGFGRETALELAGMERLVWGDDWIELTTNLERQEARWAVAGVPADLILDFRTISISCWQDLQRTVERSAGQHAGIGKGLLEARQAVHQAALAYLLKNGSGKSRDALRVRASEAVSAALPDG
jgi:hypothetical protein